MNAPVCHADFVQSLCWALAHQWEPERLFMFAYTAYLDESGTHDGSGVTIMGGLLSRADHWKRFEVEFDDIRKRHEFQIFHAKKFKKKTGDFKGWTDEECLALIDDLRTLTDFKHLEGISLALKDADYDDHYRRKDLTAPSKARFDSRYGLCFRMCLFKLISETAKHKYRKRIPDLHVVLGLRPN